MLKIFSQKERQALKEFKNQLLREIGERVLALKVFGSKARGDFKNTSDIDILILLKSENLKDKEAIFDIATKILLKYNVDLSIKIFSKKEFGKGLKLQIPFYLTVDKEARVL